MKGRKDGRLRKGIWTKEGHKEKLIMERWQMKGVVYGQKKP
jgi:hypothetical protein